MNYEELLKKAYEKVQITESSERFEIPKPRGYYEGSKTIIKNFGKICSTLRRSPEHLAKFLGKNLASPFEIKGDLLILFRRIPPKDISEKIRKYSEQYVICPKCGKPDTEIIQEGQTMLKCLACGEKKSVPEI